MNLTRATWLAACLITLLFGCKRSGDSRGYLVVDLATGETEVRSGIPDLLTNDTWKTTHMVFRKIPAGSFMMGDQAGGGQPDRPDERPVHPVTITKAFYLGVFEVTQAQYALITGEWPSNFVSDPVDLNRMRPVEQVSWDDIRGSGGFLDVANALPLLPSGLDFRLPTEAEWEYAAKAGTSTNFSYGNEIDGAFMWYAMNNDNQTQDVGTREPNPWGLYDMHGNVYEWVEDYYDAGYYQFCIDESIVEDPPGPATGMSRIARSGGVLNVYGGRSSLRDSFTQDAIFLAIGFRLALDVEAAP